MKRTGAHIVFEVDGSTLSAAKVDVRAGGVTVKAWHSETCPPTVDAHDERAMLEWASSTLKGWRLGRGRVVCCVPRAEVVLKRLHLSGAGSASDDDRAGIVALQMGRQLSLSMQDPAIDYVPIRDAADEALLDVIAGAIPGARLQWLRTLASGAGLKLTRAGLRSESVGALVAGASPEESGAVLGVSLGVATTDFVIVENGELRFARAADAGRFGADVEAYARQVAVEAKRTWMSYRMGASSVEIDQAVVLGSGDAADAVAQQCAHELEVPSQTLDCPPMVSFDESIPTDHRRACMPLVGLLAQESLGTQTMNFARPRKAADRGASTRQRSLLGVLGVIVLVGAAYLFAQGDLARLERQKKNLRGEQGQILETYMDELRLQARAEHAEHFAEAQVDWISHLAWLSETMPDPHDAIVNQIRATLQSSVTFTPRVVEDAQGRRAVRYLGGRWTHAQQMSAVIDGQVKERSIADDLRDRLLDSGIYMVDTRGPDDESSFSFELTTTVAEPMPADEEQPE